MKHIYLSLLLFSFLHPSFSQEGTRDLSFNYDGLLEIDFGLPGNVYYGTAAANYSGDRIVFGGYTAGSINRSFVLSRVNSDGSFDNTFNTNGKSILSMGTEQYSYVNDLAVLADGSVIAVGTCKNNFSSLLREAIAIVKLNPSGILDPNFDSDGKLILRLGRSDTYDKCRATGIAVQSNGKIVIGGTAYNSNGVPCILIIRLNSDGTYDNSFGTNGVFIDETSTATTYVNDILIDNSGNLLICGKAVPSTTYDFFVAKIDTYGNFDNTFGTNGKVLYDNVGNSDEAFNIGVSSTNKIIISGHTMALDQSNYVTGIDAAIFQLNLDGSLNTSFGNNGFKSINTGKSFNYGKTFVQLNDNIYFTGGRENSISGSYYETFIVKLTPDGNFDNSFGTNGIVIQQAESFEKSILLSDNSLLIVGGDGFVDGLKIFTSGTTTSTLTTSTSDEFVMAFSSSAKTIEVIVPENIKFESATIVSALGITETHNSAKIKTNLSGMVTILITTNQGTFTRKILIQE